MWALGLCVLWSTRELNTRPIRPDWRKIWARRIFGVWCRYIAIFGAVFSGIWLIHELGGFWEVAEMSSRDRNQILKEKNGDLAAFLESRQNQLKGLLFLFMLYADHLFEKRTQPDGAEVREGPEWSMRFLFMSAGALIFLSVW